MDGMMDQDKWIKESLTSNKVPDIMIDIGINLQKNKKSIWW